MNISRRLFLYIMLVIMGFAVLLLLSNTLLLKPLYHWSIKSSMSNAIDDYTSIDYSTDAEEWLLELREVSRDKAFDVVIKDKENVLYSTSKEVGIFSRPGMGQGNMLKGIVNQLFLRRPEILMRLEELPDGTRIGILPSGNGLGEMMVCTKSAGGGIDILLIQPIEPLNASVRQANILLLGCTVLSLIILVFVVLKISKGFTKPIREIQHTVGQITDLNFENRCIVTTGDELQSLGEDVNVLADQLKTALDELMEKNEQLLRDIEAQKKFIANASHELRTPLSLIKGYSDEMSSGFADNIKKNKAYSMIIADEASKMNRLLSEMLELSRMQSGQAKLQNEVLSVSEQIKSFVDKYDGFIKDNGLNVSLDLDENAIGYFDALRFEQVLANYISNAARYGDADKQVRIEARELEDIIRITVFNTGRHIADEQLESIWDGFYKGDDARTRVEGSYGLGLSIVKAIQTAAGCCYGTRNVQGGVEFWFDVRRYDNKNNNEA